MENRITILGVPIDNITLEEAEKKTLDLIKESNKTCKMIFAPNVEFIMTAQKDEEFAKILPKSSLSTPDSVGVILGGKLQNKPFKERIQGQKYFRKILELGEKEELTFYLLGGTNDTIKKAVENIKKMYHNIKIVGFHHGYLDEKENQKVIEEINSLQPNVLFVAMGAPIQEKWIYNNRKKLKVDVAAGQGGTFDFEAKKIKRAPKFLQKIGLEWLWRLIRQPKRIFRMWVLPVYLVKILIKKDKTKGKYA